MNTRESSSTIGLVDIHKLSIMMSLSKSRIQYEVFKNRIPHFKIGRSIRFCPIEIQDWLKNQRRGVK